MKEASLYIHIPFCKSKCFYCDFPSFPGMENHMEDYIRAISLELENYKEYLFNTVFIGGGTPTYLSLKGIMILKEAIAKLNIKYGAEFTIEANPKTVDIEKLLAFKEMGVNRISIGLQSIKDETLKKLNRPHNYKDFLKSYELIREVGFDNVNIDIMFSLPDEKIEDHINKLNEVVLLNPEHISCYSLIIEENTIFDKLNKENKLNIPDEEEYRQMYEKTIEILESKGYSQYEISNFSKEGYECKHNIVYWEMKDYVGIGLGAHSYIDGVRKGNTEDINAYIKEINQGRSPSISSYKNSIKDDMEEFIFLGLRKRKGISKIIFKEKFGLEFGDEFKNELKKWEEQGYIKEEGEFIYLTIEGIEISNYILSDFIR